MISQNKQGHSNFNKPQVNKNNFKVNNFQNFKFTIQGFQERKYFILLAAAKIDGFKLEGNLLYNRLNKDLKLIKRFPEKMYTSAVWHIKQASASFLGISLYQSRLSCMVLIINMAFYDSLRSSINNVQYHILYPCKLISTPTSIL